MVELKPHQAKACAQLTDGKVLYGGVGSGKTHTALAYYMKHHQDKDIYVITTARKRDELDWQITAAEFGIGKADGTVAGTLTVDSWNNIRRYEKVRGSFFIFDEQRLVGKGAWVKVFLALAKANKWILLSGTPGDTWMDFAPVFIANGFYENRTDFVRRHVVYNQFTKFPSIDRYVDTGILTRRRREVIVHMPYARRTVRHVKTIPVGHNQDLFERVKEKRWHIYEDRPLKDVGELFRIMRKLVNSDKSRLSKLSELWEKHPRLIVFYNFDYELEALREWTSKHSMSGTAIAETSGSSSTYISGGRNQDSGKPVGSTSRSSLTNSVDVLRTKSTTSTGNTIATGVQSQGDQLEQSSMTTTTLPTNLASADGLNFEVAEWNGHKHEAVPTGDRWLYFVQYTAGSEAWNCITTDAMVFYSLTYSYKVFEQCQGRIDRMNTKYKDLYYYVFRSNTFIDSAIWKALMGKQSFSERALVPKL